MKVTVPIEIDDQLISDMIITAIESGIGYWTSGIRYYDNQVEAKRTPSKTDHPIKNLSSLVILEEESANGDEDVEHTLKFSGITHCVDGYGHRARDFSQLIHGLSVMAEKYPHHFANVVADNHDAETADVFIQCCLFDEIVYS